MIDLQQIVETAKKSGWSRKDREKFYEDNGTSAVQRKEIYAAMKAAGMVGLAAGTNCAAENTNLKAGDVAWTGNGIGIARVGMVGRDDSEGGHRHQQVCFEMAKSKKQIAEFLAIMAEQEVCRAKAHQASMAWMMDH